MLLIRLIHKTQSFPQCSIFFIRQNVVFIWHYIPMSWYLGGVDINSIIIRGFKKTYRRHYDTFNWYLNNVCSIHLCCCSRNGAYVKARHIKARHPIALSIENLKAEVLTSAFLLFTVQISAFQPPKDKATRPRPHMGIINK